MIKNKWKSLFIVLAIINIVVIGSIYFLLTTPGKSNLSDENQTGNQEGIPFTIQTNKTDVNRVINHYLKEQANGTIDYQISLENYVSLIGSLPILGQSIKMKMSFEPTALENGNLILKEKEFSIGALKLPAEQVLKMVNNHFQFPEWVYIQPDEKNVLVDLQNMKLESGLKIRMNEMDLKQDKIIFTLLIPTDNES